MCSSLAPDAKIRSSSPDTRGHDVASGEAAATPTAGEVATPVAQAGDRRVYRMERWLIRRLLQLLGNPPIRVALWDAEEISTSTAPAVARILIRDRRTLWKLILSPELHFGDAFTVGQIEVEGDLLELLQAIYRSRSAASQSAGWLRSTILPWLRRAGSNTISCSRANIHHHYDIGNDFYRLWLDDEMVYSCAYFPTPDTSLDQAQRAKMDYVCRKLRLGAGDTVVDVGSGWGALPLYMAGRYGAKVKAFNISHEQISYSRKRAEAEGLRHRVEFIEDDYRNISSRFDAFVSLGMLEHVGRDHYREFGQVIDGCLNRCGRGLMQSIGQNRPGTPSPWIKRRIFPGGYCPSIQEMMDLWEPCEFSVLDVENLRLHYARTLRHWLQRFEASADAVAAMFDQRFVRTWRLYLTGSIAAFATGALQLFQIVFARPDVNEIPWTRAGLYQGSGVGSSSASSSRQGLPAR